MSYFVVVYSLVQPLPLNLFHLHLKSSYVSQNDFQQLPESMSEPIRPTVWFLHSRNTMIAGEIGEKCESGLVVKTHVSSNVFGQESDISVSFIM